MHRSTLRSIARGARAALAVLPALATLTALVAAVPAAQAAGPSLEAAFTQRVASLLRDALPQAKVEVLPAPRTIRVDNIEASLDRLQQYCREEPPQCDTIIASFVKTTADAWHTANDPPRPEDLRVVVRRADDLAARQAAQKGTLDDLGARPLAGGLVVVPVLDTPTAMAYPGPAKRQALGLDADAMLARGRANLRATQRPLEAVARPAAPGEIRRVEDGDAYVSSRLATPSDWAGLARAQGGVLVVAVPRTTEVWYVGEDDPAALDGLRRIAREHSRGAPDAISEQLFRWTPLGWQMIAPLRVTP